MFTKAIVRNPCKNMIYGLTTANFGAPNYSLAIKQHQEYILALMECGLQVLTLEADEDFPDSTFVEDTALLTQHCAIITNPGAYSRKNEIIEIEKVIQKFYPYIERIEDPGTVEAGDIMMVGNHFYIGLSERTNEHGAQQMIDILNKYKMTGSKISLDRVLHLKTGASYLEKDNLVVSSEFFTKPEFQNFNLLKIEDDEIYAANCVWINGTVLVPKRFPKAKKTIENANYKTIEVDVSEFQKLDGGLSCLSLRF
jgi:dimethylargininase